MSDVSPDLANSPRQMVHMGYLRHNQRETPATAPTVPGHGRSAKEIDMTDSNARCLGVEEGVPCDDVAVIVQPVPLCARHQTQVALAAFSKTHSAVSRLPRQRTLNFDADAAITQAERTTPTLSGAHSPVVYFILNGSRIKIGYTTNIGSRVASLALRTSDVLLVLGGGLSLEAALHERFAHLRVADTEWFEWDLEIAALIADKSGDAPTDLFTGSRHRSQVAPGSRTPPSWGRIPESLLCEVTQELLGDRRAVPLVDVLESLKRRGAAPEALNSRDLTALYRRYGIPVRRAVRVGKLVRPGVHRDDLSADQHRAHSLKKAP